MSLEEVAVLLGKKKGGIKAMDSDPAFDSIDTWPVRRRFRPAHSWGIRTPGLRRAHPFDGLLS